MKECKLLNEEKTTTFVKRLLYENKPKLCIESESSEEHTGDANAYKNDEKNSAWIKVQLK